MNPTGIIDLHLGSSAFNRLTSTLQLMYISSGALKAAFTFGIRVVV